MGPRALFIVRASIPAEKEEAFNRWYDEDHFKKALTAPGLMGGRRYKILGTGGANLRTKIEGQEKFRFMAIYEYENLDAIEAGKKSGELAKMVAEFNAAWPESERLWISAVQIYPDEKTDESNFFKKSYEKMGPRALFIVRASIPAEKEEAFNRWYDEDHFKKALTAPGLMGGRRYKILGTGGANLRTKIEGEEKFRFMAIYEYESMAIREASIKAGRLANMAAEFTATWPESERLWISAVQIYPE